MSKASRSSRGSGCLVSALLAGAWRESPPALEISKHELTMIASSLCQSGSGPLGWWRIRCSSLTGHLSWVDSEGDRTANPEDHEPLPESPAGATALLHEAYRRSRLSARIHEREISHVVPLLRAAGIEPVLVKGWAIARRYPDPALRPYGDIDLCVRPDQFTKAKAALKCLENIDGHYVDLHKGFKKLTSESWDEMFERTQLVELGDERIRVLSDEDHLRVLCLHLLRSGAWRPLWLCDVAVVLETRSPSFAWDVCLGKDRRQADAVACTLGLAHQLLGLDVSDMPVAERARRLPRWLVPAVLRQWNTCTNPDAAGMALPVLLANLRAPTKLLNELCRRWDNPVRSTALMKGRFNNWPRLPYQLAELILRSDEVPKQLWQLSRQVVRAKPTGKSMPENVWSVTSD